MIDYKKTMFNILTLVGIALVVFIGIALGIFFWPFLVAIVIAFLLEKLIEIIIRKTKISRKFIGTILVILIYAILGFVVYFIVSRLIRESVSIIGTLPKMYEESLDTFKDLYSKYIKAMDNVPDTVSTKIYEIGTDLISNLTEYITKFFNGVVDFVMFLPHVMIYVIVTFLATLFLVTDRRTISRFVQDSFPKRVVKKIVGIVKGTIGSLMNYLKAQIILIAITFVELLIAFLILKQDYPLTLAVMVALVDALPILGTGTVLIPWSIYSAAVVGDMNQAIGLFVCYIIILIVRQLVEPRIVGGNIGVHPFITLISMYIGFKLFGLLGLIIGPVVMVIFKNVFAGLSENNYLKNIIALKEKDK